MKKREKDIAWTVANGQMTKAEAARKLNRTNVGVNSKLFNGLVETLKDMEVIKT